MNETISELEEKSFSFWYNEMLNSLNEGLNDYAEISKMHMIHFFWGDKENVLSTINIHKYYDLILKYIKKYDKTDSENFQVDDKIYLNLALCYLSIGNYFHAFNCLNKIKRDDCKTEEFYFSLGFCNVNFKRYQTAIELFSKNEKSTNEIIKYDSIFFKAFCFIKIDNVALAIDEFQKLIGLKHPQISTEDINFQIYSLQFQIAIMTNFQKQMENDQNYVVINPQMEEFLKNADVKMIQIAYFNLLIGNYDQVIKDLSSTNRDPKSFYDKYLLIGYSYYQKNEYVESYKYFSQLLKYNRISWEIWFFLGLIFLKTGNFDEALKCFSNSSAINPTFIKTQLNLGSTLELSKRTNDAYEVYSQISKIQAFHKYSDIRIDLLKQIDSARQPGTNPEIFEIDFDEFFIPPSERFLNNFLNCPVFFSQETMSFLECNPEFTLVHSKVSLFPDSINI